MTLRIAALISWLGAVAMVRGTEVPCDLDPLLVPPGNWELTADALEEKFKDGDKPLFRWLTRDRTRAKFSRGLHAEAEIMLSAFEGEVPVEEAIVDFADGKLNLVTLSIHNRGDAGSITAEDFGKRYTVVGKAMGAALEARAVRRDADSRAGLLTEGYAWNSARGQALLEHNEGAMKNARREFLRLRIARPGATGSLAAAMANRRGGAAAKLGDLPRNVRRDDNGDVHILNIPMVDQGTKGYCVVATAQRTFEYYGIGADMHQLAQITKADPERGTSTLLMAKELDSIDYRFKTRLEIIGMAGPRGLTDVDEKRGEYYVGDPVDQRKFLKEIHGYIDKGLPLLWSLELGQFPEQPHLNPQTSGGHMRMIIGYNTGTGELIFSDSWGAGHEFKRMKADHAYAATQGLFVLKPTVH